MSKILFLSLKKTDETDNYLSSIFHHFVQLILLQVRELVPGFTIRLQTFQTLFLGFNRNVECDEEK